MNEQQWELQYYITENGKAPYREWFQLVNDFKTQHIIITRLARVSAGNFGACESVGSGVFELKIYYGPGYRVYFGRVDEKIILLLCGGDKSTQQKDIQTAHRYWQSYKERRK